MMLFLGLLNLILAGGDIAVFSSTGDPMAILAAVIGFGVGTWCLLSDSN